MLVTRCWRNLGAQRCTAESASMACLRRRHFVDNAECIGLGRLNKGPRGVSGWVVTGECGVSASICGISSAQSAKVFAVDLDGSLTAAVWLVGVLQDRYGVVERVLTGQVRLVGGEVPGAVDGGAGQKVAMPAGGCKGGRNAILVCCILVA